MTTTITTTPTTVTDRITTRRPLWKAAVTSGVAAAAATTLTVAVARSADIAVAVQDEQIPLLGFAQLTIVGALIGLALGRVLSTRARHPRRTFIRSTVVLTVLSIVPDVMVDASTGSKLVLALTHMMAAAIVIPALASRLAH